MAITGRLEADFTSFFTACEQAVVNLKALDAGAGTVKTQLTKMVDSLSGGKIITQAGLMAEAVDRVGGTSKLTAAELQRVGAQAQEAADKLRAMGMDVPPGIQKIANEARGATTAHGDLLGSVKQLALGFAAMFSVRAAYSFVTGILDDASALADLSQQTHISVEAVQVLGGAMSEFGVDSAEMAKALFTLSRKAAGGDDSVATGLHMMGLSLKDIKGLEGEALFLKIMNGLAGLQGGLRDTASAELFGSKLGMAMAGASEGIDGTITKWRDMNTVISGESVAAMDEYGETTARAWKDIQAAAGNAIGPLAQGFNTLTDATTQGATSGDIFWAMLKDLGTTLTGVGGETSAVSALLEDLRVKEDAGAVAAKGAAAAHTEVTVALNARQQAMRFMDKLQEDAGAGLDSWQRSDLAHLKEIGALNAKNAAAIGISASQYAAYTAEVAAAEAAAKKLDSEEEAAAKKRDAAIQQSEKLLNEFNTTRVEQGGTANEIAIAQINQWAADVKAAAHRAGTDTDEFNQRLAQVSEQKIRGVGKDWTFLNTHSQANLREMAENAKATFDEMVNGSRAFSRDAIEEMRQRVYDAQDEAMGLGKAYKAAFAEAAQGARDAAAETKRLGDEARKAREQGGSFAVADLTEQQFNAAGGARKIAQIEAGYAANPGRRDGGSGTTGTVGEAGYRNLLEEQRLYAALLKYLATHDGPGGGGTTRGGIQATPLGNLPTDNGVAFGAGRGGGGVTVTNTFHIVDTESNIARRVSATVLRTVMQNQRFAGA